MQEELLRRITLEEKIGADQNYTGLPNRLIPFNDFLKGYFQSIDLGFESLAHFSCSFKKKFGMAPTALTYGFSPT